MYAGVHEHFEGDSDAVAATQIAFQKVTGPRSGEDRGPVYTKDVRGGRHYLDQAEVKEVVFASNSVAGTADKVVVSTVVVLIRPTPS